jgi:putative FmdB family regulatory protein
MPIYQYECADCNKSYERIFKISSCPEFLFCNCGAKAQKVISASKVNCSNQDAKWIREVRDVVNRRGGQHCQDFLNEPTRKNYHQWMKGEGLRHLEKGERMSPEPLPKHLDEAHTKEMIERAEARRNTQS